MSNLLEIKDLHVNAGEKEILKGSNGSNYIRYFDGTNDINTLIP